MNYTHTTDHGRVRGLVTGTDQCSYSIWTLEDGVLGEQFTGRAGAERLHRRAGAVGQLTRVLLGRSVQSHQDTAQRWIGTSCRRNKETYRKLKPTCLSLYHQALTRAAARDFTCPLQILRCFIQKWLFICFTKFLRAYHWVLDWLSDKTREIVMVFFPHNSLYFVSEMEMISCHNESSNQMQP